MDQEEPIDLAEQMKRDGIVYCHVCDGVRETVHDCFCGFCRAAADLCECGWAKEQRTGMIQD